MNGSEKHANALFLALKLYNIALTLFALSLYLPYLTAVPIITKHSPAAVHIFGLADTWAYEDFIIPGGVMEQQHKGYISPFLWRIVKLWLKPILHHVPNDPAALKSNFGNQHLCLHIVFLHADSSHFPSVCICIMYLVGNLSEKYIFLCPL